MNHDVTLCEIPSCELCAAFEDGYTRGKSKTQFEMDVWDGTHALTCGCEPCRIVRCILAKVKSRPIPELDLPGPFH